MGYLYIGGTQQRACTKALQVVLVFWEHEDKTLKSCGDIESLVPLKYVPRNFDWNNIGGRWSIAQFIVHHWLGESLKLPPGKAKMLDTKWNLGQKVFNLLEPFEGKPAFRIHERELHALVEEATTI